MRNNIVFGFAFFLGLFCLQSCKQEAGDKLNTYDKYRTQHLEYRDSLFVFYTVERWNDSNWDVYEDRSKMLNGTNAQIKYFNGGSFYSPDKLKLIVWEGEQTPNTSTIASYSKDSLTNRECPSSGDTVFNLRAVIGFRTDTGQIWMLYPLNNQLVGCARSREQAINVMGQYYFEQMKTHAMWRLMQGGPQKGTEVSCPYGFNLQDAGFWEKCWLWEKDSLTSNGLYPFQMKGRDRAFDGTLRADPFTPPKIEYPDYILKLYQGH